MDDSIEKMLLELDSQEGVFEKKKVKKKKVNQTKKDTGGSKSARKNGKKVNSKGKALPSKPANYAVPLTDLDLLWLDDDNDQQVIIGEKSFTKLRRRRSTASHCLATPDGNLPIPDNSLAESACASLSIRNKKKIRQSCLFESFDVSTPPISAASAGTLVENSDESDDGDDVEKSFKNRSFNIVPESPCDLVIPESQDRDDNLYDDVVMSSVDQQDLDNSRISALNQISELASEMLSLSTTDRNLNQSCNSSEKAQEFPGHECRGLNAANESETYTSSRNNLEVPKKQTLKTSTPVNTPSTTRSRSLLRNLNSPILQSTEKTPNQGEGKTKNVSFSAFNSVKEFGNSSSDDSSNATRRHGSSTTNHSSLTISHTSDSQQQYLEMETNIDDGITVNLKGKSLQVSLPSKNSSKLVNASVNTQSSQLDSADRTPKKLHLSVTSPLHGDLSFQISVTGDNNVTNRSSRKNLCRSFSSPDISLHEVSPDRKADKSMQVSFISPKPNKRSQSEGRLSSSKLCPGKGSLDVLNSFSTLKNKGTQVTANSFSHLSCEKRKMANVSRSSSGSSNYMTAESTGCSFETPVLRMQNDVNAMPTPQSTQNLDALFDSESDDNFDFQSLLQNSKAKAVGGKELLNLFNDNDSDEFVLQSQKKSKKKKNKKCVIVDANDSNKACNRGRKAKDNSSTKGQKKEKKKNHANSESGIKGRKCVENKKKEDKRQSELKISNKGKCSSKKILAEVHHNSAINVDDLLTDDEDEFVISSPKNQSKNVEKDQTIERKHIQDTNLPSNEQLGIENSVVTNVSCFEFPHLDTVNASPVVDDFICQQPKNLNTFKQHIQKAAEISLHDSMGSATKAIGPTHTKSTIMKLSNPYQTDTEMTKDYTEKFLTPRQKKNILSDDDDDDDNEEDEFENFLSNIKNTTVKNATVCSNELESSGDEDSDFIVGDDYYTSDEDNNDSAFYIKTTRMVEAEEITSQDQNFHSNVDEPYRRIVDSSDDETPKLENTVTVDDFNDSLPTLDLTPLSKPIAKTLPKTLPAEKVERKRMPVFSKSTSDVCEPFSFVESLTAIVSEKLRHPEATKYMQQFKRHKVELVEKLMDKFCVKVFENKLKSCEIPVEWNTRLRKTAGYCKYTRQKNNGEIARKAIIELSVKVCDTAERTRDTLIHELCHAAVWLLYGTNEGHGPLWKNCAAKANKIYPRLPVILRCHSYEIATKYTYRCMKCSYQIGRHSKSLDTIRKVCGKCGGEFECLVNLKDGAVRPSTTKKPNKFAMFVKENYSSVKKSGAKLKHKDIMNILSKDFSTKNIISEEYSALKEIQNTPITDNDDNVFEIN